jgi:hypothetical protein
VSRLSVARRRVFNLEGYDHLGYGYGYGYGYVLRYRSTSVP